MRDYGLIDHNVTLNFNATNENYISEQDKDFGDHEEIYLSSEIGEGPVEKGKDIADKILKLMVKLSSLAIHSLLMENKFLSPVTMQVILPKHCLN